MKRLLQFCLLAVLIPVLALLSFSLYVLWITAPYIYTSAALTPTADVALVLGASVTGGGDLSPILKERADRAIELYNEHTVKKILVTGDNATRQYDEVYPVGKYLVQHGIPQKDIFLDYAGFDTYSSMFRARDVFQVKSMIVVSQQFHLPRALFIAHSLQLEAYGIDASHGKTHIANSLRELPAEVKAVFDVLSYRKPKYLGQTFPISGDGSATFVGGSLEMIYFNNEQ